MPASDWDAYLDQARVQIELVREVPFEKGRRASSVSRRLSRCRPFVSFSNWTWDWPAFTVTFKFTMATEADGIYCGTRAWNSAENGANVRCNSLSRRTSVMYEVCVSFPTLSDAELAKTFRRCFK